MQGFQPMGKGHHDKRTKPEHTKSVECSACYARLWVAPTTKSGYCATCRANLFNDKSVNTRDLYQLHSAPSKPTSAAPARPAIEVRRAHVEMIVERLKETA